jgi:hypothetical protein
MQNLALYDTLTAEIRGYPRHDDEPVEGLDPRYLVLRVVREPAPEPGENQQVTQTRTVDLEALELRWGWSVVDLPPPAPEPDWRTFKRTLLAHPAINMLLGGGISTAPAAALSLPATLLAASGGGDVDDFRGAWVALRRNGLVSAELLQEVRMLAIGLHLPEAFIAALGGAARPAAHYVGQEWVDSTGDLWVVNQARGEDGQFLADDPETEEKESLIWEKV